MTKTVSYSNTTIISHIYLRNARVPYSYDVTQKYPPSKFPCVWQGTMPEVGPDLIEGEITERQYNSMVAPMREAFLFVHLVGIVFVAAIIWMASSLG
jgi:hypothetical protein